MREFLNGQVIVRVDNYDQSHELICLAIENGFEGDTPMLDVNSYKRSPYYFIEDGLQLNATLDPNHEIESGNAFKIVKFSDLFPTH